MFTESSSKAVGAPISAAAHSRSIFDDCILEGKGRRRGRGRRKGKEVEGFDPITFLLTKHFLLQVHAAKHAITCTKLHAIYLTDSMCSNY